MQQAFQLALQKVVDERLTLEGSCAAPHFTDVLWVQLLLLPYTVGKYFYWYLNWIYRIDLMKEEYQDEDKM